MEARAGMIDPHGLDQEYVGSNGMCSGACNKPASLLSRSLAPMDCLLSFLSCFAINDTYHSAWPALKFGSVTDCH